MLLIGLVLERGLFRFFYRRSHAEQILVTFGLAIVLQEIIKAFFGANPIPVPAPPALAGTANVGIWLGLGPGARNGTAPKPTPPTLGQHHARERDGMKREQVILERC